MIDLIPLALANQRSIVHERQPAEIFEDRLFVDLAAALAVVVLNPQHHTPARIATRGTPNVQRVQDVAEVKIACRGWSESRDDRH